MPYQVKRKFGGYAVLDAAGEEVKSFSGTGAKLAAEEYADKNNGASLADLESYGRGGLGRGGRGRGGK